MADTLTPEQRRRCMSHIKNKNTKPELLLRRALWKEGLRYRLHYSHLPGKPDLVFAGSKVVVFIDGCFWHGCPIHGALPKTNQDFWKQKIYKNIKRDREVSNTLQEKGWKVLRFWQHELKKELPEVVSRIRQFVKPRNEIEHINYQAYRFEPVRTIADTECGSQL